MGVGVGGGGVSGRHTHHFVVSVFSIAFRGRNKLETCFYEIWCFGVEIRSDTVKACATLAVVNHATHSTPRLHISNPLATIISASQPWV